MPTRLALTGLTLSAALAGQAVIVPSAVATTQPTSTTFYTSNVFYSTSSTTTAHDSHAQMIYDVADVQTPSATWTGLAVRRPVGLGNSNPAMTTTATIVMSVSPLAYAATTTNFAGNHGVTTTVLSGSINLPANGNLPTWPAPWETPFPFSASFSYSNTAGQSLVVDIMQTGNSATTPWYVEAWYPDTGRRASNPSAQSSCRFSNGNYNSGLSYRLPVVGGGWYVNYSSVLPNAPGFAAIGVQGVGGNWLGLPLPFDLGVFGATGCSWNVSMDVTVPITANASGTAGWPTNLVTIPNQRWFIGRDFYDHAALVDPAANAFGIVTTWSSKWTIGSNRGQPGAFVSAVGNSAGNATGSRVNEATVSLLLQ
ncbi:MAG: hypothetical protein R3F56_13380 [Planctomycetota bacterium]